MWEYEIGDVVLWPNGVEGHVCGIDNDEGLLLDGCGGWHDARDVDPISREQDA